MREIHIALGTIDGPCGGPPQEVFIETEDENGNGIAVPSVPTDGGRDLVISIEDHIRDFLTASRADAGPAIDKATIGWLLVRLKEPPPLNSYLDGNSIVTLAQLGDELTIRKFPNGVKVRLLSNQEYIEVLFSTRAFGKLIAELVGNPAFRVIL